LADVHMASFRAPSPKGGNRFWTEIPGSDGHAAAVACVGTTVSFAG
jgi:hypothetical protein